MMPYHTFGLRLVDPSGPPAPEPTCEWVTGSWTFVRKQGPWCHYTRTVTSSVAGCTPSDPMPEGTKRERC